MDTLNDEERALAWLATWTPSFVGKAIVAPDFTFRAVNQQWCEFLGVTPAEFIGKSFSDITPHPYRSLDEQNARLVKQGRITSYILPKCYELSNGKRVDFVLLVVGIYHKTSGEFLFYVSQIMKGLDVSQSPTPSPKPTLSIFQKIKDYWPVITALLGAIALLAAEILKRVS